MSARTSRGSTMVGIFLDRMSRGRRKGSSYLGALQGVSQDAEGKILTKDVTQVAGGKILTKDVTQDAEGKILMKDVTQIAEGKILTKDVTQDAKGKILRKESDLAGGFFCKIL